MKIERLLEDSDWVQALAANLVNNADDAEDIVQDTWMAALTNGPHSVSRSRSWLRRVLRNFAYLTFRNRTRREARERAAATSETSYPPESHASQAENSELVKRLVHLVEQLDAIYREVVLLRFVEGLTSTEISSRLGIKPAAVRMRLKRALETLRRRLDAEHDGHRKQWSAVLVAALLLRPRTAPAFAGSAPAFAGSAAATFAAKAATIALVIGGGFLSGWMARDDAVLVTTREAQLALAPREPCPVHACDCEAPPTDAGAYEYDKEGEGEGKGEGDDDDDNDDDAALAATSSAPDWLDIEPNVS